MRPSLILLGRCCAGSVLSRETSLKLYTERVEEPLDNPSGKAHKRLIVCGFFALRRRTTRHRGDLLVRCSNPCGIRAWTGPEQDAGHANSGRRASAITG